MRIDKIRGMLWGADIRQIVSNTQRQEHTTQTYTTVWHSQWWLIRCCSTTSIRMWTSLHYTWSAAASMLHHAMIICPWRAIGQSTLSIFSISNVASLQQAVSARWGGGGDVRSSDNDETTMMTTTTMTATTMTIITITIMTTQVGMLWQLPLSKDKEWTAGRCEAGWESLMIMLAPTASALA